MNILIKGMEMPYTCLSCDFHKCAAGVGDYCTLTKKKQFRFKNRPSSCPLVPVPPHGRLIDADKLCLSSGFSTATEYGMGRSDQIEAIKSNAPTIIPADDPKEE